MTTQIIRKIWIVFLVFWILDILHYIGATAKKSSLSHVAYSVDADLANSFGNYNLKVICNLNKVSMYFDTFYYRLMKNTCSGMKWVYFVATRRKRNTVKLVAIVVLCILLLAIGVGIGIGVNKHTGMSYL